MKSVITYFGSFNPTHIGHLAQLNLLSSISDVDVILSPHNPHKDPNDLLPFGLRKDICQVSIEEYSKLSDKTIVSINDIENDMDQPNYTYLTLRKLTEFYGDRPIIALGTDVINQLHTWKKSEEIAEYEIIECKRPGYKLNPQIELQKTITIQATINISSTEIRNIMIDREKRNLVLERGLMTPTAFKMLNRHYELSNFNQ